MNVLAPAFLMGLLFGIGVGFVLYHVLFLAYIRKSSRRR